MGACFQSLFKDLKTLIRLNSDIIALGAYLNSMDAYAFFGLVILTKRSGLDRSQTPAQSNYEIRAFLVLFFGVGLIKVLDKSYL